MKTRSKFLNHEARERLQILISEKMAEINIVCRDEIKCGLDYLEEARASVYTEDADTVQALLKLASKKFDIGFGMDAEAIDNMADVAREIHDGELKVNKEEKCQKKD